LTAHPFNPSTLGSRGVLFCFLEEWAIVVVVVMVVVVVLDFVLVLKRF